MPHKDLEERKRYQKQYRAHHRNRLLAEMRKWYMDHRDNQLRKFKDYGADQRQKNPGYERFRALKKRYGLDEARWNALVVEQDGLCAVCRKKSPTDVDHNHETGQVRGLLCRKCNLVLGFLEDTEKHKLFVEYLARWQG